MKNTTKTTLAVIGLSLLVGFGCGKSDSPSPTRSASPATEGAAPAPAIEETVKNVGDTAKKAIDDASNQANDLITKAQTLVNEKKYTEALELLNQLANMKLTPDQQKLLDSLKATVQKGLQSKAGEEATKAVGNLMGGQK